MTETGTDQEPLAESRGFRLPKHRMEEVLALAKSKNTFVPRIEEAAVGSAVTQFQTALPDEQEKLTAEFREGITRQQDETAREKPVMVRRFVQLPRNTDNDLVSIARRLGVTPEHFIAYAADRYVTTEQQSIDNWKKDEEKKNNTITLPGSGVHYKERRVTWTTLPYDHMILGLKDTDSIDLAEFDAGARKLIEASNEALDKLSQKHPEVLRFSSDDTLKYIVLHQQEGDVTQDAMIVFPYSRVHDDVRLDLQKDDVRGSVVSAGFVKINSNENTTTRLIFGHSESLEETLPARESDIYRATVLQPKLADKSFTFK
jgi:hypothetical protein